MLIGQRFSIVYIGERLNGKETVHVYIMEKTVIEQEEVNWLIEAQNYFLFKSKLTSLDIPGHVIELEQKDEKTYGGFKTLRQLDGKLLEQVWIKFRIWKDEILKHKALMKAPSDPIKDLANSMARVYKMQSDIGKHDFWTMLQTEFMKALARKDNG